jgi:phenylacetate-CoA ligase
VDRAQILGPFLDALRNTQYLPAQQLIQHQREQLELLVRHARKHVPFYRDSGRLDPLFNGDAIDWDRWGEIPLLTRKEVQQAGPALRSEFLPPEHGGSSPMMTSGTTGEPVTVWHSTLSNPLVREAVIARNLERHGIDPLQRLAFIFHFDSAHLPDHAPRRHPGGYDTYSEPGLIGERFDISEHWTPREIIDALVSVRPKFVRVQPIVLELVRAFDHDRRLPDLGISVVFAVGDQFERKAKEEIADYLGCWIIDLYGSKECGRIATSCPECGRFHAEAETVFVEVLRDDGRVAAPGEKGWVVATPLYNYAMPLIRYDHVDQAVVGRPDFCTITLPVLDAVLGKERVPFTFPGGISIRPTVPLGPLVKLLGAQAYQVAQVAEDRCEIRIVPGTIAPSDMRFAEMTDVLRSNWWEGLKVDYRIMSELPRRSSRGKVASIVQEFVGASAIHSGRIDR